MGRGEKGCKIEDFEKQKIPFFMRNETRHDFFSLVSCIFYESLPDSIIRGTNLEITPAIIIVATQRHEFMLRTNF